MVSPDSEETDIDLTEVERLESEISNQTKQIKKLEMQVKLGGNLAKELERQKAVALEAQEEVRKSIQYASRIQGAMLPSSLPDDLLIDRIWNP